MSLPSALAATAPYPLTPLDVAAGFPAGMDETRPDAVATEGGDFASGFRSVIRAAVAGRPTFVSFSGGRDSSAILAVATDEARRLGQADPVPVTLRIEGSAAADETSWQELVVGHLGLRDWIRIPVRDELDVLGPVATRTLSAHGLLYPANAYFHDLIAEHVPGGVLLAGAGGDELLEGSFAHHHALVRLGEQRWTPRTAAAIAASVLAGPLYELVQARTVPQLDWLRPRVQRRFARRVVGGDPPPVQGWAPSMKALPRMRAAVALQRSLDLIGAARGVRIVNPFLDPAAVGAAMAQGGVRGLGGRIVATSMLAGDLLPQAVPARQTKASFEDAMWTELGRERLRSGELVDVLAADERLARLLRLDRLRSEWSAVAPHTHTALLAQVAQLALAGRTVER